ncbi:Dipeptidyl aminopeptidase BIII [Thalassocella blandensis]|nr:Dipeptidyl aminopeptidase BIII [Thalassocella blandensis]
MHKIKQGLLCLVCAVVCSITLAVDADEIPIEQFAMRDVVSNVSLSPDGKYLSLLKISGNEGNPVLEVYQSDKLSEKPFRMNADPMEIVNHYWVSKTKIVFQVRQRMQDYIEGFNDGVFESRLAILDVKKEKSKIIDDSSLVIEHLLPSKPNKILVSLNEGGANSDKLSEAFRPRAYFEMDLNSGNKSLLIRGKIALGNIDFDQNGNPRIARGIDIQKGEYVWYYRGEKDKDWNEFYRQSEDSFEAFFVQGLDNSLPGHVLVVANNGHDKAGLWSYDVKNKKFGEMIYRRNDVDVMGVRFHSNKWTQLDTPAAVSYFKDTFHYEYFDGSEEALYQQLGKIIPEAGYLRINSRTQSGKDMIVYNESDHDPGTYYFIHDGKLQTVGSRQPLIRSKDLAEVRYITYKARDGKTIPGFITVPNSKPPYPLVVMPHGGPFVQETIIYDEWAQFLANRGFLVLQPQYRGSKGYGLDFYMSAFKDGGQGGYKMQDDKDDGALYLVREGLADPQQMAMFGWSYGGYAALVAGSRKEQIYQCVIAGAAVSDPNMQINYYRYHMRGAQKEEQLRMWDDSISPIEEVAKVNVPMLVIHGSVDQRVPPAHANKYRKQLKKFKKTFEYLELEGADHFSNTLYYDHQFKLYTAMETFLKQDCGLNTAERKQVGKK